MTFLFDMSSEFDLSRSYIRIFFINERKCKMYPKIFIKTADDFVIDFYLSLYL